MLDELQLFRGSDYILNDYITIHHPTLNEICDFGEHQYFSMASGLTASPSAYKVALFDMGIDYEEISDFDFFYLMCRGLTLEHTKILLGELDLSKFEMMVNPETDEMFLVDNDSEIIIDRTIYTLMMDFIRKLHGFEKLVERAGNKNTKKYLIDKDRRKLERLKRQPKKSFLLPLISGMVNCEQFKYNHKTVWELPIYVFNDSVKRIQKLKNYNQTMQGVYAGTIDIKKVDTSELNWLN